MSRKTARPSESSENTGYLSSSLKARQDRLIKISELVKAERKLMRLAPVERRDEILALIAREYPLLSPRKREEYVDTVELILSRDD